MMWSLSSGDTDTRPLGEHLASLLEQVEPVVDAVEKLAEDGFEMDWFCFLDVEGDQGGETLDPDLLARLAALPIALSLDIPSAGPGPGDLADSPAFDAARWHWVVDEVLCRVGMWVGRPTYARARSWVEGFGATDDFLGGFQRWLTKGPLAWPAVVLDEVLPGRNEDDLVYPGEDSIAIAHLRDRLLEYPQRPSDDRPGDGATGAADGRGVGLPAMPTGSPQGFSTHRGPSAQRVQDHHRGKATPDVDGENQ